jgi:hypothetical protein
VGIDIYLEWDGMSTEEKEKQGMATFSTTAGATGYLREAYHGDPYATQILVREAFEADNCRAEIPAAIMRERMCSVTEPAYGKTAGHQAAKMLGTIVQAAIDSGVDPSVSLVGKIPSGSGQTLPMTVEEAIETRAREIYEASENEIALTKKSFWDFVELAERKERELGKPCTVFAWY